MERIQINVRLNDKDYKLLKKRLETTKLSQSEYFRKLIRNKKIHTIKDLKSVYLELHRIGNNINQLTRLCHQGKIKVVNMEQYSSEVKRIWQLLNLLIQNPR